MDNAFSYDEIVDLNNLFAALNRTNNYRKAFVDFLEGLKEHVFFQKGNIYFFRNVEGHIVFDDFIAVDWGDDKSLDSYLNHYADVDDVLPVISMNRPVMFRSSDLFIHGERSKSKYYQEMLVPARIEYSIEGNIYDGDDENFVGIGIHRGREHNDFTQKELEILKLARPHLCNVAQKQIESITNIEMDIIQKSGISISDIAEVGLCAFDKEYNLIESNFDRIGFLPKESFGEMQSILTTLCKSLKSKIDIDGISEDEADNIVTSRINLGLDSYYAEVSYKGNPASDFRFVVAIYYYNNVFEQIIMEMKERFNLTEREFEIIRLVIKGFSNSEIGEALYISIPTVKKHLSNIYLKMGIEGKHQILGVLIE